MNDAEPARLHGMHIFSLSITDKKSEQLSMRNYTSFVNLVFTSFGAIKLRNILVYTLF